MGRKNNGHCSHTLKEDSPKVGAWFRLKVGRCGYRVADTMVRGVSTKMVGIIFNLGTYLLKESTEELDPKQYPNPPTNLLLFLLLCVFINPPPSWQSSSPSSRLRHPLSLSRLHRPAPSPPLPQIVDCCVDAPSTPLSTQSLPRFLPPLSAVIVVVVVVIAPPAFCCHCHRCRRRRSQRCKKYWLVVVWSSPSAPPSTQSSPPLLAQQ
jgi:hypothetical protein